ncbi:MAG: 6-carboxytetrahydropterin synthase [Oligoflexia bacterium]|nr:6-carboxytetrahydropterin synthase [Oligoflexia bacterium]
MNEIFLEKFTVLDFAFLEDSDIRGESYYCSARLSGVLDHRGFVYDFGPAKNHLKKVIDEEFDHRFLVNQILKKEESDSYSIQTEKFSYQAPQSAYAYVQEDTLNKKKLEHEIVKAVMRSMPASVTSVEIELQEASRFRNEANYSYTHGLPYHEGNCQRLVHGHRNPIEVYVRGDRAPEREFFLAKLWENAHFTQRRIISKGIDSLESLKDGRRDRNNDQLISMGYGANQGSFSLTIPVSKIVLMSNEPSVENIAQLAYRTILEEYNQNDGLVVKVYEGLNKGAICRSL